MAHIIIFQPIVNGLFTRRQVLSQVEANSDHSSMAMNVLNKLHIIRGFQWLMIMLYLTKCVFIRNTLITTFQKKPQLFLEERNVYIRRLSNQSVWY